MSTPTDPHPNRTRVVRDLEVRRKRIKKEDESNDNDNDNEINNTLVLTNPVDPDNIISNTNGVEAASVISNMENSGIKKEDESNDNDNENEINDTLVLANPVDPDNIISNTNGVEVTSVTSNMENSGIENEGETNNNSNNENEINNDQDNAQGHDHDHDARPWESFTIEDNQQVTPGQVLVATYHWYLQQQQQHQQQQQQQHQYTTSRVPPATTTVDDVIAMINTVDITSVIRNCDINNESEANNNNNNNSDNENDINNDHNHDARPWESLTIEMMVNILSYLDVRSLIEIKPVSYLAKTLATFAISSKTMRTPFGTTSELRAAVEQYCGPAQAVPYDLRTARQQYCDREAAEDIACTYGWPINNWDVSRIEDFSGVFYGGDMIWNNVTSRMEFATGVSLFDEDISSWDVSQGTTMEAMFAKSWKFNQDLSKWNIFRVRDMKGMFAEAKEFNQDLEPWDFRKVTNMRHMFYQASKFDQDVTSWLIREEVRRLMD